MRPLKTDSVPGFLKKNTPMFLSTLCYLLSRTVINRLIPPPKDPEMSEDKVTVSIARFFFNVRGCDARFFLFKKCYITGAKRAYCLPGK